MRRRLFEAVCEGAPARFCAKVTHVRCERDLRAAQRELAMLDAARGLPGVVQLWRGGAGCPRRPRVHEFVDPATGDLCCAIVMRCGGCLGFRVQGFVFMDPATSDLRRTVFVDVVRQLPRFRVSRLCLWTRVLVTCAAPSLCHADVPESLARCCAVPSV